MGLAYPACGLLCYGTCGIRHPGDIRFFPGLLRVWVLPLGFLPGAGGSL